jgi:hypothetical protein
VAIASNRGLCGLVFVENNCGDRVALLTSRLCPCSEHQSCDAPAFDPVRVGSLRTSTATSSASWRAAGPGGDWLCSNDLAVIAVAPLGAGVGMLTAMIVDATYLAREPARRGEPKTSRAALRWSPSVAVSPKGEPSAGVVGTF